MDGTRFDDLIKRLTARRLTRLTALRALAASVAALTGVDLLTATARRKGEGKKKDEKPIRICVCQGPDVSTCKQQKKAKTKAKKLLRRNACAYRGRCQGFSGCPNSACLCPAGQHCLLNGTCARPCTLDGDDCVGCSGDGTVLCSDPTAEGGRNCNVVPIPVPGCETLQACGSTADCPRGFQCQGCGMSATKRCIEVADCPAI